MTFSLNQIFSDTYPPEAAQFCNANGYVIKEIESQDSKRRFQIQEVPALTAEEVTEQRRQEILAELDHIDRASSRSLRAILTAQTAGQTPDHADIEALTAYETAAIELRRELAELNA